MTDRKKHPERKRKKKKRIKKEPESALNNAMPTGRQATAEETAKTDMKEEQPPTVETKEST